MREMFEKRLREKLEQTNTQPKSDLWEQIEGRLTETDFESMIGQKLEETKIPEPSPAVWAKIEDQLHPRGRLLIPYFRTWAVAASILLVLGLSLLYFPSQESLQSAELAIHKPTLAPDQTNDSDKVEIPQESIQPLTAGRQNHPQLIDNKVFPEPEQIPVELASVTAKRDTPDTAVSPSVLEELLYTQLPDTTFVLPQVQDFLADALQEATQVTMPEDLPAQKNRGGLETAVNYVFSKIFGLPEARIKIDEDTKNETPVWKVQFDSRLLSFSGNLPSGKKQ